MGGNLPATKIIGGVTFNANEVKASTERVVNNKPKGGGIHSDFKQYTEYTVELRDGTTLIFAQQDEYRKAKVEFAPNGSVNFYSLYDAEIIDTDKDDIYNLIGCKFTHVEAARSKTETVVSGGGCTRKKEHKVDVSLDHDQINAFDRAWSADLGLNHYDARRSENNYAKVYQQTEDVRGSGINGN